MAVKTLLKKYRAKRDFTQTAEPSGDKTRRKLGQSYLIQKHAASHLHYDFRLEMDGVLKSWAVTKGPSLDPETKRLAVHVEDHPLDYGSFEGTIPQGQYGGGTVMLWDEGTWEPIGDAERDYKKGNLTFELHGKRLKGRWHLVRMRGREKDRGRENWLLIKGKDDYANEKNGDVALQKFQTSVTTDRSMEAIAEARKGKVWRSGRAHTVTKKAEKPVKPALKKKAPHKPNRKLVAPPDFIAPQLATLVDVPPKGIGWLHEIKFDGYRLQARLADGKARLVTRTGKDWTAKFSGIATALEQLDLDNALLDGEVVHVDNNGGMSFHGLQNALSEGEQSRMHYYLFDLLFLNGEDIRGKPLTERKSQLQKILRQAPAILHDSEGFDDTGEKVLQHACGIALEGIISKRADAAYHSGRGELWVKSKCIKEQEAVIGGYTMQPKHAGYLGALLMGYYKGKELIFAGKVGTGFTHKEGRNLLQKLQKLKARTSSFESVPTDKKRGAVWVEPKLVAQIHFGEWTPDGRMRHPSFGGLREDKPATDVLREKEKHMTNPKPGKKSASISSKNKCVIGGVTLTHPDKKLYPGTDITKRDLALYYEKAAPLMLPQVANRPVSLMRCPEGEGKPCFFQRHGGAMLSPYVKPVKVKGHGDNQPFLMIEDVGGLIGLVQMGMLELHVWGSRAGAPEKPDRIVFDFDPAPDVAFTRVKDAALLAKKNLEKLKLKSFLKTTGGKGLHVVVPIAIGPGWDDVKAFALAFAQIMEQDAPDEFVTNMRKDLRKGRIFIDYLRNTETASAIAPYSTRARHGAPVALPLDWKELPKLKSGADFDIGTIDARLKKDPWKEMAKLKQKLPQAD